MNRTFGGAAALMLVCVMLLTTGCDMLEPLIPLSDGNSTIITDASDIGDGRTADGYADGRLGDTLVNEFFSFCVNSAELIGEYEGTTPEDGNIFLRADLTVKNVFGDVVPMYSADFQVQWGEGEEDYGYPIAKVADEQMEDEYELAKGETVNATVVYEIPRLEGKNEYSVSYLEIYEDDVEGNVFFVYFDLETP
ncbi:MAG: DUF4352 domain-containing protein [Oscillospiraceae bacterium]|nr:DUF4352 domain-containing protein [Oscillospiraceae bacterium]